MTIAAMKQALEALESCDTGDYSTGHVLPPSFNERDVDAAITALRAAIEQAEKAEPVAWQCKAKTGISTCYVYDKASAERATDLWNVIPLYLHPAPVPAGWQLVPVEPTPEMIRASWDLASVGMFPDGTKHYISIAYKAMLAASPKPGEMK